MWNGSSAQPGTSCRIAREDREPTQATARVSGERARSSAFGRHYRVALKLFGVTVLCFLAWHSRGALREVLDNVDPQHFVIACAAGVMFTVVQGLLFLRLVRKHSHGHTNSNLLAAFLLSQPGKYVPGKIWAPLMQALALKQPANVAALAVANVELTAIGAIQMSALGLACLHATELLFLSGIIAVASALCVAIIGLPTITWLARPFPRFARWLKLPAIDEDWQAARLSESLGLTLLSFAANFAASWCVLLAAGATIPSGMALHTLASLYLGFVTGLLAFPVPAGIGVREAATVGFGALLVPQIPASLLVSVALLVRCWQLLVDATCLGLGALLQSRKN